MAAAAKCSNPGSRVEDALGDRSLRVIEPSREQEDLGLRRLHDRDRQGVLFQRDREPFVGQALASVDLPEARVRGTHLGSADRLGDHEPGELGVLDARLHLLERSTDEGLAIALEHNAIAIPIAKSAQAEIFLLAGRLEDAESAIAESLLTRLPGLLHFAAAANSQILKGRIAAIRRDHAGAVEIADQVVEWLRPLGVRPYIPAALLLKGSSLVELGKLDEAERALQEASAEAEQLGFDPDPMADRG